MKQVTLTPTRLTSSQSTALNQLSKFADIMMPGEAEEPILAPPVRAAVFEWLAEIRASDDLAAVGCKPRRSALLFGPPGCGKTTLAHHFAARLGMPLACVRSESLIESWLGKTGQNIGALFDAMKASEGSVVVFFDEVDALGGRRMNDQGASVERANSLNVLLRRIEAFEGVSLAATNRQDFIDPALWRRFGMQISVELPGGDERFAIIRRYAAPFVLSDAETDAIVDCTDGASPALLRALMEGIKRSIVIGPRIKRDISAALPVIEAVVASCVPAPEYDRPFLWSSKEALEFVSRSLDWPLQRGEA
jgi:SpoVK/Ycf46/Vps4 family AAA+-type ATPase